MKLKCISTMRSDSELFGLVKKSPKKVAGLTKDRVYQAQAVAVSSGGGSEGDSIVVSEIHFVVFNDEKKWTTYPTDLFEPAA